VLDNFVDQYLKFVMHTMPLIDSDQQSKSQSMLDSLENVSLHALCVSLPDSTIELPSHQRAKNPPALALLSVAFTRT